MQRRLTAILAADVAGYSGLMEADEAGVAAVDCALAIQGKTMLAEPGRDEATSIRYRIGINLGEVIVEGDDIYGDGVNVAARLQALAPVDGIAVVAHRAQPGGGQGGLHVRGSRRAHRRGGASFAGSTGRAPFLKRGRLPMSDEPSLAMTVRARSPNRCPRSHARVAPDAPWNREGLRDDSEYRDLGLAAATGGRIGVKHIRALKPMTAPTGWHWHDMTAHYVYVLRGSLTFRFAGVEGDVTLRAGDGLSQPAGVPHNVVARSDDLEVIEINEPAEYGTWNLPEPPAPWR